MKQCTQAISPRSPVLQGLARPALVSAVFFMLITGLAYPLLTTGVAQLMFPHQANGSLVRSSGQAVGAALIGQAFVTPPYFHPRPSVTQGTNPADASATVDSPYNAALSGASNLGPTSRTLMGQVQARARAYRQENGLPADTPVPVDAVTASASGLDPDISLANARLQAARVAKARGLDVGRVMLLVQQQTTARQLGILGEPRINVLAINLALDGLAARHAVIE